MKIDNIVNYRMQKNSLNTKFGSGYMRAGMTNANPRLLEALTPPELKTEVCKTVYARLMTLLSGLKKLGGNASISTPVLISADGKNIGLTISKKDNEVSFLLKDKINSVTDWNKTAIKGQSILEVKLDENGVLKSGELAKNLKENYQQSLKFSKVKVDTRRIRTEDGIVYAPARDSQAEWAPQINVSSKKYVTSLMDIKKDFSDITFAELFAELANGSTRIK